MIWNRRDGRHAAPARVRIVMDEAHGWPPAVHVELPVDAVAPSAPRVHRISHATEVAMSWRRDESGAVDDKDGDGPVEDDD